MDPALVGRAHHYISAIRYCGCCAPASNHWMLGVIWVKRNIYYAKARQRAKVDYPLPVIKCASIIAKYLTPGRERKRRSYSVCFDWPIRCWPSGNCNTQRDKSV